MQISIREWCLRDHVTVRVVPVVAPGAAVGLLARVHTLVSRQVGLCGWCEVAQLTLEGSLACSKHSTGPKHQLILSTVVSVHNTYKTLKLFKLFLSFKQGFVKPTFKLKMTLLLCISIHFNSTSVCKFEMQFCMLLCSIQIQKHILNLSLTLIWV